MSPAPLLGRFFTSFRMTPHRDTATLDPVILRSADETSFVLKNLSLTHKYAVIISKNAILMIIRAFSPKHKPKSAKIPHFPYDLVKLWTFGSTIGKILHFVQNDSVESVSF